MRQRRRIAFGAAALALVALVAPAAAQGSGTSVTESLITDLNTNLLAIALPITLLVEGILVYTVWKFRKNDEPSPTEENRRLEISWTVATAVILLYVGFASYGVFASPQVTATAETVENIEGDEVVVEAVGVQWFWEFRYPEQNVSVQQDTMVVPADRPLVIKTTATDVIHAFHAPALGLKADAIPGQYNYLQTEITEPGTYQLYCAEYCGAGHSAMLAEIRVLPPDEYEEWVAEQSGNATADAAA
jgi:cytochrome c oxidase subunit 2